MSWQGRLSQFLAECTSFILVVEIISLFWQIMMQLLPESREGQAHVAGSVVSTARQIARKGFLCVFRTRDS